MHTRYITLMTATATETPVKTMTLKCQHGEGHEWTRPSQRGKPPHFCPDHTPAKKDKIVVPRVKALTDGERAELTPEQIAEREAKMAKVRAAKEEKARLEEIARIEGEKNELEELKVKVPNTFKSYEEALDKALAAKHNEAKAAWRICENYMSAAMNQSARLRKLEAAHG